MLELSDFQALECLAASEIASSVDLSGAERLGVREVLHQGAGGAQVENG